MDIKLNLDLTVFELAELKAAVKYWCNELEKTMENSSTDQYANQYAKIYEDRHKDLTSLLNKIYEAETNFKFE